MRAARWVAMAVVAGTLMGHARGQGTDAAVLEQGPLVVWWVTRATAQDKAIVAGRKLTATVGPPTKSVEKTMGEFGEESSNVGQTSSSYGQTASSLGTAASDTGQTAGSTGQTAGSFGRTSSSVGQTAGSYGQTAGSLGQSASSYGESIAQASQPVPLPGQMTRRSVVNLAQRGLVDMLRGSYPGVQAQFIDVLDVELREKLERAQGTEEYPDVVVGVENLPWWKDSGLGMMMLGVPSTFERVDRFSDVGPLYDARYATILKGARHMAQAKAFVVWVRDQGLCELVCLTEVQARMRATMQDEVWKAAQGAVTLVLGASGLGGVADPAAAEYNAALAEWLALGEGRGLKTEEAEGSGIQLTPLHVDVMGPVAVVMVRAVLNGESSFGVAHALVVLRKRDGGGWKVLQVSPNMWPGPLGRAEQTLVVALKRGGPDATVQGVSLAAPPDGDNRQAEPELWWDNKGGGRLEVVEWQEKIGGVWSNTSLEMFPDLDSRLHTRVVARFATQPTAYRWRVWSAGSGGQLRLSEWRTFMVLGR